jgi:hypothetical protein
MKQPTNEFLFLICSSSLISFSSLSFSLTAEFSMLSIPLKQPMNGFVQHHPADGLLCITIKWVFSNGAKLLPPFTQMGILNLMFL